MERKELEGKKVAELKAIANGLSIELSGSVRKAELIEMILGVVNAPKVPKIKPELIGGEVYVPILKGMTIITEDKAAYFANLGLTHLFQDDDTNLQRSRKQRYTNVDRVGKP